MNQLKRCLHSFAANQDGAQVIEYSLIIAVVAIGLLIALRGLLGTDFTGFIARLNGCLMNSTCT